MYVISQLTSSYSRVSWICEMFLRCVKWIVPWDHRLPAVLREVECHPQPWLCSLCSHFHVPGWWLHLQLSWQQKLLHAKLAAQNCTSDCLLWILLKLFFLISSETSTLWKLYPCVWSWLIASQWENLPRTSETFSLPDCKHWLVCWWQTWVWWGLKRHISFEQVYEPWQGAGFSNGDLVFLLDGQQTQDETGLFLDLLRTVQSRK